MSNPATEARQFVERGEYLLEVSRPKEAIREFERALAQQPEDALIFCNFAHAFIALDDYGRAMDYARRALSADPSEEWAFRLLAVAHGGKDENKLAYRAAASAVQLAPASVECLYLLAVYAFALERIEEALMLGEMIVSQYPTHTSGHRVLGWVAARRQDLGAAIGHYEKVIEINPTDAHAMDRLAEIRNKYNRYGDSVSLLRGAVSVDPNPKDRQTELRDSMASFALFGEPGNRRKSVGGLLVSAFIAYLVVGFFLYRQLGSPDWFGGVFLIALPAPVLLALPMLRARFFARQSARLNLLYRNMSRMQRRKSLLVSIVIIVTAYGIATIVYLNFGQPEVFYRPIRLLLWGTWAYMLWITLRLILLWSSDILDRLTGSEQRHDDRRIPLTMLLLPFVTMSGLIAGLHYMVIFLAVGSLTLMVITVIWYLRRFPRQTCVSLVLLGVGIIVYATVSGDSHSDPAIIGIGFAVIFFGIMGGLLYGISAFEKFWQRRRITKLLGAADG